MLCLSRLPRLRRTCVHGALALVVLSLASAVLADDATDALPFRVPEGFVVSRVADDSLAHDVFSLTLDAKGRPVVSGPGYIRTLIDADGDGRAESAEEFSNLPDSGAQGLCFDGPQLWFTGDGMLGRLTDANGDGRADGPPEAVLKLRNPEHGAHAIVKGPDGFLHVMCGNDSAVGKEHLRGSNSPVAEPLSGAVLRVAPDGQQVAALAHGFRNPYDLDFADSGEMLTVDSDGERAYHLPWYEPTRLFDVAVGIHHGWLEKGWVVSWSRPEWFFDNVPRVAEMGRGSPTGLTVYRHRQFPERYRGGVFCACWTLGRIYFVPLAREGNSFRAPAETFLETLGNVGFAPVDLVVDPQGDLLVAIGGRRTSGGLFRIHHAQAAVVEPASLPDAALEGLAAIPADRAADVASALLADQPLEAWSRAKWTPAADRLGVEALAAIAQHEPMPLYARVRAIEILVERHGGLGADVAAALAATNAAEVRARLAWALARSAKNTSAVAQLCQLTADADPRVARAAWENLLLADATSDVSAAAWQAAAEGADARLRAAAIAAARRFKSESPETLLQAPGAAAAPRPVLAQLRASDPTRGLPGERTEAWIALCIDRCHQVIEQVPDAAIRLEAVRLLQLALGDLQAGGPSRGEHEDGYTARAAAKVDAAARERLGALVAATFPTGDRPLDLELSRLAAMLEVELPALLEKLPAQWTADSRVADDVHYLIVASRVPGPRSETFSQRSAAALCGLHRKLRATGQQISRTWPFHVGKTYQNLARHDERLHGVLAAAEAFGLPDHSLFVELMPEAPALAAAKRLAEACRDDAVDDSDWSDSLVRCLSRMPPDECRPLLREKYDAAVERGPILAVLARGAEEDDRERFLAALDWGDAEVVRRAANALNELPQPGDDRQIVATLRSLRRMASVLSREGEPRALPPGVNPQQVVEQFRPAIDALTFLLVSWTGGDATKRLPTDADAAQVLALCDRWFKWFERRYPDEASQMTGLAATNLTAWSDRFRTVAWDEGDAERGRRVYEKQQCHRCHQGNARLGPELTGIAARLSRDDLLAAILDPNREVSPLYRTRLLATRSGKLFHGLVVYESPEGTLIQTGVDTTIRVPGEDFLSLTDSPQSLMPTGLLDPLSDGDLADLYAYLQTLRAPTAGASAGQ